MFVYLFGLGGLLLLDCKRYSSIELWYCDVGPKSVNLWYARDIRAVDIHAI
jgi:hypothetical protein